MCITYFLGWFGERKPVSLLLSDNVSIHIEDTVIKAHMPYTSTHVIYIFVARKLNPLVSELKK